MTKILLIDDEHLITEPLERALKQQCYTVFVANNGQIGLEKALFTEPDVVVLDIMMPEMDGWAVCRKLREHSSVPILMLTALNDEVDRILGLELGADDYLAKPFSTRELIARIKALLRRVELDRSEPFHTRLKIGDVELNRDTHQVHKGGELLAVRHKEFELLYLLMSRAGEAIARPDIFDQVWGIDWIGDTRTLDVHVRWLREKIEDDASQPVYIQTVRGVGYRFRTETI